MMEPGAGAALIWCPFSALEDVHPVAEVMLQENLVACVNILPEIVSIFRYEGIVQSASEVAALFKTEASLLQKATSRLAELHPYDTPAVCGWLVDNAPRETREWLAGLLAEEGMK